MDPNIDLLGDKKWESYPDPDTEGDPRLKDPEMVEWDKRNKKIYLKTY